jgi:hypothetical protein
MRAGIEQHLGSQQVAKVVYGSIIGLALVVAVEAHPPAPGVMAVWLAGTAVAVGLAEVFSEVVGFETRTRRPVVRSDLAHFGQHALAVGFGIVFPVVFFVLAAVGVLETDAAFRIAKWTGVGLIGFYGFWAARFAGAARHKALVQGILVALVGAALVLLKSLVH